MLRLCRHRWRRPWRIMMLGRQRRRKSRTPTGSGTVVRHSHRRRPNRPQYPRDMDLQAAHFPDTAPAVITVMSTKATDQHQQEVVAAGGRSRLRSTQRATATTDTKSHGQGTTLRHLHLRRHTLIALKGPIM